MDILNTRRIVNTDRMNDGIVIKFDDGRCAFFSCALLYATLPKCEPLDETIATW